MTAFDGQLDRSALDALLAPGAALVTSVHAEGDAIVLGGARLSLCVPARVDSKWPRLITLVRRAIDRHEDLSPDAQRVRDELRVDLEQQELGPASRARLLGELDEIASWADRRHDSSRGPIDPLMSTLYRRHLAEHRALHGKAALAAELWDAQQRDRAHADPQFRHSLINHWNDRLMRLQRARPRFWDVPNYGARDDQTTDIRHELLLRLLEEFRGPGVPCASYEAPGEESMLRFLVRQVDLMRQHVRMHVVPDRLNLRAFVPRTLDPEEQLVREEAARLVDETAARVVAAAAGSSAAVRLSQPQTRWLRQLLEVATEHNRADTWGLAAEAARRLGKARSSATRAITGLREALGGSAVVDALAEESADDDAQRAAQADGILGRQVADFHEFAADADPVGVYEVLKASADLAGVSHEAFAMHIGLSLSHVRADANAYRQRPALRRERDRSPWSLD